MLTLEEVEKEIEKLKKYKMNYNICQILASLYILEDHMRGPGKLEEEIPTQLPHSLK